jgi:hypothetical protein
VIFLTKVSHSLKKNCTHTYFKNQLFYKKFLDCLLDYVLESIDDEWKQFFKKVVVIGAKGSSGRGACQVCFHLISLFFSFSCDIIDIICFAFGISDLVLFLMIFFLNYFLILGIRRFSC